MIENLNDINDFSLVVDEYNNYYTIYKINSDKTEIVLSNFLYTLTCNRTFSLELIEEYRHKSISEFTSKELAESIKINEKKGNIFKLEDLKKSDIKIEFRDCTKSVKRDFVVRKKFEQI